MKIINTFISSLPNTMLTQHELDIIFYFSQRLSQKEVAKCLHLSHRTIENKLQGIMKQWRLIIRKNSKNILKSAD